MEIFSLVGPDNDSHMCGSSDLLLPELSVPTCIACGYKTDLYFVNPSFRVKRRVFDLSATYDGYDIASRKLAEACARLNLKGISFVSLPADQDFFVVVPQSITRFDSLARGTRFMNLCVTCGFHESVAGATPVHLLDLPTSDISATDVVFGSGNARSRVLIATHHAKTLLTREKLKGLQFELARPNNSFKPSPLRGLGKTVP